MADETPSHPQAAPPVKPHAPTELYSIVTLGNHDPRQHHPFWYRLIDAVSDDELKIAVSNGIATPDFVTFDAGVFSILSDFRRWQIATPREENLPRMISVVRKVFDEKLYQVSISAIGASCLFNSETKAKKVGKLVVRSLELGGIIPVIDGAADGSTVAIWETAERKVRAEIGESINGPSLASISYNVHRDLAKKSGYYALAGELQHCESDWRHGKRFAAEVVSKINALSDGNNAS